MESQTPVPTGKEFFFDHLIKETKALTKKDTIRVLELGCGTAPYAPAIIDQHPTVEYVGVEPFLKSYSKAKERLAGLDRATVHHQLGYDQVEGLPEASFDLVLSISVLEHVKQLSRFIALGACYAKAGALIVHRYDLGHALYPGSFKERFQVWLGNHIPDVLPEHKFVRYVPMNEVTALFEKHHQQTPFRYTYHQMPNTKRLDSIIRTKDLDASPMRELYEWELHHSEVFAKLPLEKRERLFPAIAVWGRQTN